MSQTRSPALPSFSGLAAAVNEARDGGNNSSNSNNNNNNNSVGDSRPDSRTEARGVRRESMDGKRRVATATCNSDAGSSEAFGRTSVGSTLTKSTYAHHSSPSTVLLQDTLTPLLDEVDLLFERSKEIVATVKARGNGEDVRALFVWSHFHVSLFLPGFACIVLCGAGLEVSDFCAGVDSNHQSVHHHDEESMLRVLPVHVNIASPFDKSFDWSYVRWCLSSRGSLPRA